MDSSGLQIFQSEEYQGEDWWNWSVWIGPPEALSNVESVEYTLHPSFPNPVRRIDAPSANQFRLSTAGWGIFTIYAKVKQKDGSVVKLRHELELTYPDGTPTEN
jgi:transcription initiation factor IIF auxiliary subunit